MNDFRYGHLTDSVVVHGDRNVILQQIGAGSSAGAPSAATVEEAAAWLFAMPAPLFLDRPTQYSGRRPGSSI
ncbi:hypothetical protein ACFQ9X_39320 [Catenulispora yoronensis]